MKQLTQSEFDALDDGPHDARVVGAPPSGESVFAWLGWSWAIVNCCSFLEWWFDSEGINNKPVDEIPIWHKITYPADYVENEQ